MRSRFLIGDGALQQQQQLLLQCVHAWKRALQYLTAAAAAAVAAVGASGEGL